VPIILDTAPRATVPRWPGYAALGVGGVALTTGVLFHLRALDAKDAANHLPTDDPRFTDELDRFESRRAFALGGYAVGAIAVGIGAWWLLDHAAERGPQISGSIGKDGATVTLGWTLGGP